MNPTRVQKLFPPKSLLWIVRGLPDSPRLENLRKAAILYVYVYMGGHVAKTARYLGITRPTVKKYINQTEEEMKSHWKLEHGLT